MENEKRINWLSLFIKIVIVFIFILIIIWLVSKIIGNNKLSETFKNNINNMEKVSIDYFKTIDLPLDKGKSIKITLKELIDKKLIVSNNNDSDNICDTEKSYSEIIREKNKYIVETTLKCGKEKDTITKDFSLKDCKNCNKTENNNDKEKEEKPSNKKENTDNNTNSSSKGTKYYEHVKKTTEYTKWMRGTTTGENIENRYEYYGIDHETYYTIAAIPTDEKTISYVLKLDEVPNNKYYFTTIKEVEYFNEYEEYNFKNENKVSIIEGIKIKSPEIISEYSLGESNITYKLSPYYREGNYYIRVTIIVEDTTGINYYYDNEIQKNIYLIPLKINVKFASNVIQETKPLGEYETISYYRYVTVSKKTIWSTKKTIKGYTKTGKTKIQ